MFAGYVGVFLWLFFSPKTTNDCTAAAMMKPEALICTKQSSAG